MRKWWFLFASLFVLEDHRSVELKDFHNKLKVCILLSRVLSSAPPCTPPPKVLMESGISWGNHELETKFLFDIRACPHQMEVVVVAVIIAIVIIFIFLFPLKKLLAKPGEKKCL